MRLPRLSLVLLILGLAIPTLNAQTEPPPPTPVTNPPDLKFQARLLSDSHEFHTGEPIQIEISFSSDAEKKYQTSRMNPNPDLGGVVPQLSSMDGVTNLSALRRDPDGGFGGSFLSGGPEFLQSNPITQRVDLSAWYRFQKPGHYSVTVTSNTVWRIKTVEEGGGREIFDLESNAVEFEIVPHSTEWDAMELANIQQALESVNNPGERLAPIQRMAYLDTPAAIRNIVTLFLQSSNDSSGWLIYSGLRESSQTDLIIPLLQSALTDPSVTVPSQLPELLASLQTRRDLGLQGPAPSDPAQKAAWDQKLKEWYKVRDGYLARNNAQLLAGIQLRTGPSRAKAIYQAWANAERLNVSTPQPPNFLAQLRQEAFNVERELEPYQRLELVRSSVQALPQEQLLPIVRDVSRGTGPAADNYVFTAFELWCHNWQDGCNAEILHSAADPETKLNKLEFLMLSESERLELDAILQERLMDPNLVWSGFTSNNLSALVLRAGSKNLVPAVDAVLDRYAAMERRECETQAYFIGYLFRFNPKDAGARLSAMIQNPSDQCGGQILGLLSQTRYFDAMLPIAAQALNSPNLSVAATSAVFIGAHAPESAKAVLLQRLDSLHRDWHSRAAELQSSAFSWGSTPPELAARLEQSLTSALVNGANWHVTDADRENLRSACLTEMCRNVADGKMRIGM
jgi:hypothetical protein